MLLHFKIIIVVQVKCVMALPYDVPEFLRTAGL